MAIYFPAAISDVSGSRSPCCPMSDPTLGWVRALNWQKAIPIILAEKLSAKLAPSINLLCVQVRDHASIRAA